jgi:hemoglobin
MNRLMTAFVLSGGLLAGCATKGSTDHPAAMKDQEVAKSLYERLGGEAAIKAVVDDFVGRAAADPKVNFTRKGSSMEWNPSAENVAKLKTHLVQFISMATGGPKKYEGRGMKPVHAGMGITEVEFGALAADLIASLDKFGVPQKEKDELITIVASTKKDIVER